MGKESTPARFFMGFTFIFVVAGLFPSCRGLLCHQCGSQSEGMSTVNPCFTISDDDLKLCEGENPYCKRYNNKGVIVLECSSECKAKHTQNTEITCCQTDGCNVATSVQPSPRALIFPFALLPCFLLWQQY